MWANRELFPDLSESRFHSLVKKLASTPIESSVKFDPHLAGDRVSLDQKTGGFSGLSLATTRNHLLGAIVESLAQASAKRIPLLQAIGTPIHHDVLMSGGLAGDLADVLHRDWPGKWKFAYVDEATLKGLARLPKRRDLPKGH